MADAAPVDTPRAPSPFSSDHDADGAGYPSDFVLRSSDGVDFYVHREILKFASDAFHGMLTIPTDESAQENLWMDGKPVVVVSESQDVLYRLLTLAYPARTPTVYTLQGSDLDGTVDLYLAAQKYHFGDVQRVLKAMLNALPSTLINAQPHRIFGIASAIGCRDLVRRAALATLQSSEGHLGPAFPEMGLLSWGDARKLSEFRERCSLGAVEIAERHFRKRLFIIERAALLMHQEFYTYVWWSNGDPWISHSPKCTVAQVGDSRLNQPSRWFGNHFARLTKELRSRPCIEIFTAFKIAPEDQRLVNLCPTCLESAERDLGVFMQDMERDVAELLKVALNDTFKEEDGDQRTPSRDA